MSSKCLTMRLLKKLSFDVIAMTVTYQNRDPTNVITTKTRVIIHVLDMDDNCPIIKSPKYFEVSRSSPLVQNIDVAHVEISDKDTFKNHTFSLNNALFAISNNGIITSNTLLESLVERVYNLTVTVADSRCIVNSYVAVRLTVCPKPMTYMFTSDAFYVRNIPEDKNKQDTILTVAIQGSYPRIFSIVGSAPNTQFKINGATGNLLFFLYSFDVLHACFASTLLSRFHPV